MSNGKGSKVANNFRTPQWEESKLWDEKKIKNTRIFNDNKDEIEGSNVDVSEAMIFDRALTEEDIKMLYNKQQLKQAPGQEGV